MTMANLQIDIDLIEPSLLIESLGYPAHRLEMQDAHLGTLTLSGIDQATAEAALTAYRPKAPAAQDVRAEAERRMMALLGARDARHLDLLIANGTREAIRLIRQREERPWTADEAARAAALEATDAAIEAIRTASNALESMAPVPADYTADARWP